MSEATTAAPKGVKFADAEKRITPKSTPRADSLSIPATGATAAWKILTDQPTIGTKFQGIKLAARQRQNEIDKRSAKMFAVHQRVSEAVRSRKTYAEIRNLIGNSNVVVELPNERQKKMQEATVGKDAAALTLNVSYRQQGNLDMYSSDNMKIREKNRHHPEVRAAIEKFWGALPKTPLGNVNKSIYVWYSRQLFFTFVPGGTEHEFQQVVQEDWKNDAVWSCSMNERMFSYAIYNLADIWCETLDPIEYRDFITRCADIVIAAAPYTGSRKDADVTDTNERANVRRLSIQPGAAEARRPSGFEIFDDEEDEEPIEEVLERLERECANAENNAWYTAIESFCNFAATEAEDCEEDLVKSFGAVQSRRYETYHDDQDPSFHLERAFLRELQLDSGRRQGRLQDIKERLDILRRPINNKGDIYSRQKKREKETLQHQKEQKSLLSELRDHTLNAFVRLRQYRNSLMDLQRSNLRDIMSRVDSVQTDLRAFFALQITDATRRSEGESERNDDYFTNFTNITRDLEEARKLIQFRISEPIEQEIYNPTGQKDRDELQFDSPKWVTLCEWVDRLRMQRADVIEQALYELDEIVTKSQFRGKEQLFAIHRQQMDFETKLINALAETNLLQNDIKIARLAEAKKAQADGTDRRAKECENFQNYVSMWKATLAALQDSHKKRTSAESRELKAWLKATSVSAAFTASKEVLTIMSDDCGEQEMAETTFTGPRVATELPPSATMPLHLYTFVQNQHDSWLLSFMEKVAMSRAKVLEQYHNFIFRIESDEEVRQNENNLALLNQRLDDIHRIKGELGEEEARALLTVSCQVRLNHSGEVKDAIGQVEELLEMTRASIERFALLFEQRHSQREAGISKLFAQQRYQLLKLSELINTRLQSWESRYTNQTAQARKAIMQSQTASEMRRREEERIRAARERMLAEAAEAEARRLQRMQDAEEEKKKLDEFKELKAKEQAEVRKKHMKEREALIQERLRREKEERQAWRQAFLNEKEQQQNRRNTVVSPPPQKIANKKPPVPAPVSTATVTVRRKKSTTTGDVPPPSITRTRLQNVIENEIQMFRNLNTESMAVNINDFNTRRMEYLIEDASNRSIYKSECSRLQAESKASVEVLLSEVPLEFQLAVLPLSHFVGLQIRTLFDIISMNPVQKILCRGIGLDKDAMKKLAQTLLGHPFIHILDVSANKELGPHGGQSLLALVKENPRISTVMADDCGVEPDVLREIEAVTRKNQFARGFSRTDFDFISDLFKQLDQDGNGTVDAKELLAFLKTASPKKDKSEVNLSDTQNASMAVESAERRRDDIRSVLLDLDAKGKSGGFTLVDLFTSIYPQISEKDAREFIGKYSDETNASLELSELQEFMDTYGTNGKLNLKQLAHGLDENMDALEAAFQEADMDDDGFLNMSEFVMFINQ